MRTIHRLKPRFCKIDFSFCSLPCLAALKVFGKVFLKSKLSCAFEDFMNRNYAEPLSKKGSACVFLHKYTEGSPGKLSVMVSSL